MTHSLAESLNGHTPVGWATDFCHGAGFPVTHENLRAVVSWEYAESAGGGGMLNPLNTTQGGYPGETDYNSVGVKNYERYEHGIAANAKVVHNGYYPQVVAAFMRGDDARRTCDEVTASPWGTGYIALRDIGPTPNPQTGDTMQLIASPHKPNPATRVAAARWNPAHPNVVLLTNGASIAHDVPIGGGLRQWSPPQPPGTQGVGIMPTIDKKGRPDGRGIVFQDDHGDTYIGLWS